MARRHSTILAAGALGCLSWACGGNLIQEIAPNSPAASPPATVSPAPGGFLHVLASRHVTTYRIDGTTGRLTMTADQLMGDAKEIATDPDGRFVFAAFGGYRDPQEAARPDGVLVAYEADPQDGSLIAKSSVPAFSFGSPGFSHRGWEWLAGGIGRVFAVWLEQWGTMYRHSTYSYASFAVDADGRLGTPYVRELPPDDDRGLFALDARAGVVYKQGHYHWPESLGGVTAHVVEPDGGLTQTGWSNLCVATTVGVTPLLGVRDFLFASAYLGEGPTTCTWEGRRLAPRADLGPGFGTPLAVLDPADGADPAQVASSRTTPARSGQPARHELLLFAVTPGGDPQQTAAVETFDAVGQVAFHPSSRFLYANVGTALWGYAIGPDGRLTKVEDLAAGAGRMAISVPQAGVDPR